MSIAQEVLEEDALRNKETTVYVSMSVAEFITEYVSAVVNIE